MPKTLNWSLQLSFVDQVKRAFLLLIYKILVIVPVIAVIKQVLRGTRSAWRLLQLYGH